MSTPSTRTKVRYLTLDHLGTTINLPTMAAPGMCRKGTLTAIHPNNLTDTTTLVIGDHKHQVPNGAIVYIEHTVELTGL